MCGRFTQSYTWRELYELYRLTCQPVNIKPRYNIARATLINVVVPHGTGRDLPTMRSGLIPSWWKKTAKEASSTFNARAETVATKPMFRAAFKRSRCLFPASGYYEWKATPTGKQPYYISAHDASVLSFAGLWDEWRDIETGEVLHHHRHRRQRFDPENSRPHAGSDSARAIRTVAKRCFGHGIAQARAGGHAANVARITEGEPDRQ